MESSKIKELAQDQQDYVVAMRREFHGPTECKKSADIVLDIDGYQITYKQCPIHLLF